MRRLLVCLVLLAGLGRAASIGHDNNNPGNIRSWHPKQWKGCVGVDPWRHLVFATPEDGLRAMRKVLRAYHRKHKLHKLAAIGNRWAGPPRTPAQVEQKRGYLRALAQYSGHKVTDSVDLSDPHEMARFARAIVIAENGYDPYPWGLYEKIFILEGRNHAHAHGTTGP